MQAHITMTGLQSTGNDIYGESISFGFWTENNLSSSLISHSTVQKNSKHAECAVRSLRRNALKQLQLKQGNVYLGFGQFSGETIGFAVT